MRKIIRYYLINLGALYFTARIVDGLVYQGGIRTLLVGGGVFAVINLLLVPFLKILFLPLNILTLGIFSWIINVLALYALTTAVSEFKILPFHFDGINLGPIYIGQYDLTAFWVAVIASFVIGIITHFLQWLTH